MRTPKVSFLQINKKRGAQFQPWMVSSYSSPVRWDLGGLWKAVCSARDCIMKPRGVNPQGQKADCLEEGSQWPARPHSWTCPILSPALLPGLSDWLLTAGIPAGESLLKRGCKNRLLSFWLTPSCLLIPGEASCLSQVPTEKTVMQKGRPLEELRQSSAGQWPQPHSSPADWQSVSSDWLQPVHECAV